MAKEPLRIEIDGMHCDACVRRVTQALGRVPGVEVDSVKVGQASVAYDPASTQPQVIADAIAKIGFAVTEQSSR